LTRLDRYILGQLIPAFGFFVLVFTGVVWLTQAVRLIDTVLASGQSAGVFLEFSVLVLPQVFVIVLPLSGIGASLYTLNKLYSDSELVVMMASGMGPLGMLRSIFLFGAILAAGMALVLMVLVPISGRKLAERTQAVRSDLASALIVERQFLHPAKGLTLFISDTSRTGEMAGIFINDQRELEHPVTYSAEQAQLLRDGAEVRLVLLDGIALSPGASGGQINTIQFEQFVFDLSELVKDESGRTPRPSEYSVFELLHPNAAMLAYKKYSRIDYTTEAHYKIVLPLLAMTFPMIALVTLLAGGYRRSGFGRRVVVAVGVSAALQVAMFVARSRVQGGDAPWLLMYLPVLVAVLYTGTLINMLSSPAAPRELAA
jgi:lipopolysaccharide export system permease protein